MNSAGGVVAPPPIVLSASPVATAASQQQQPQQQQVPLAVADGRFVVFQALSNLIARHHLYVFFAMDPGPLAPFYDAFDALLAARSPALAAHLANSGVLTEMYLFGWLQTLFLKALPLSAAARVWDLFLLEGTPALYRVAAAILDLLAPRLLGTGRGRGHPAPPDETIQLLTQPPAMRNMWAGAWAALAEPDTLFAAVRAVVLPPALALDIEDLVADPFFYRHVRVGTGGGSGGRTVPSPSTYVTDTAGGRRDSAASSASVAAAITSLTERAGGRRGEAPDARSTGGTAAATAAAAAALRLF